MLPCLFVFALYLGLLLLKFLLALRAARRIPAAPPADFSEVTILQPVVSGDPRLPEFLRATLASFDTSSVVWIADDDDVAAIELCERLAREHPAQPLLLLKTPPPPQGENPKAFKLARAEADILTRFVVVLDDDTRLTAPGLRALLGGLDHSALSTGLPCYLPGPNVPSNLVAQFVNNQSVLTYLPLLTFFPPVTTNGMCYALRTRQLADLGGFDRIRRFAADDLAIAQLVLAAGLTIHQTTTPHFIATSVQGWKHYVRLMQRWFVFANLLVRDQSPGKLVLILFFHGLPPLLLWLALWAMLATRTAPGLLVALGALLLRALLLVAVQKRFFGAAMHRPTLSFFSELLQPLHLFHGACSRTVLWRKRWIKVRSNQNFRYI